jgi:hypothetical protein
VVLLYVAHGGRRQLARDGVIHATWDDGHTHARVEARLSSSAAAYIDVPCPQTTVYNTRSVGLDGLSTWRFFGPRRRRLRRPARRRLADCTGWTALAGRPRSRLEVLCDGPAGGGPAEHLDCPGPEPPFLAVKGPARPYKNAHTKLIYYMYEKR